MRQMVPIREYKRKPLKPEVQTKLERSHQECHDLTERELRCPYCGRFLLTLLSDAAGHLTAPCKNCKSLITFNLACFRRKGRRGIFLDNCKTETTE